MTLRHDELDQSFTISCQAKVIPTEPSKFSVSFGEKRIEIPKELTHDGQWHNFVISNSEEAPMAVYIDGDLKGYNCSKCKFLMDAPDSHDDSAMCEVQQVLGS